MNSRKCTEQHAACSSLRRGDDDFSVSPLLIFAASVHSRISSGRYCLGHFDVGDLALNVRAGHITVRAQRLIDFRSIEFVSS